MKLTKALSLLALTAFLLSGMSASGAEPPVSKVRERVMQQLEAIKTPIDGIELYVVQVDAERRFSYGVVKDRQHVFIRCMAGGKVAWDEMALGIGKEGETVEQRLSDQLGWYRDLKGKTPAEAIRYLVEHRAERYVGALEHAELVVLDLAGRLLGKPTTEILGLTGTAPIPGLYCILSDDPETVRKEAKRALEQNLRTHLKVKLYGKPETDQAVVNAAVEVFGVDAYIAGDVNMGYRPKISEEPVDKIIAAMVALRDLGLDACEDPARMTNDQWAQVQKSIGSMSLIPDGPLRPAWKSWVNLDPHLGHIYNMHPSCMGSIIDMVELGKVIQANGKKMMVGDASLVGVGCPSWEQLAIAMNADWVEAIEKPQENDVFQRCTLVNPVQRTSDGKFEVKKFLPGFGVELDEKKLRTLASGFLSL